MPPSRNRKIFFALLFFSAAALSAHAQNVILHLRNGDRLSGTILSENAEQVVLTTPWSKRIIVPMQEVSRREDLIETPQPPPIPNQIAVPTVNESDEPELLMAEAERNEGGFRFAPTEMWHGKIDMGLDLAFGPVQRQLYYGKAKIVYAPLELPDGITTFASRFRNTFEYQVSYGKTEGILSDNRMDGLIKPEFDIGRRVFTYMLFGAGYDEARKMDFRYQLGPGLGYRLVKTPRLQLNTELGFDYQVQFLQGNEADERFSVRLAQDARWIIGDRFVFDEKFEYFPSVQNTDEYRIRFEASLRYRIWGLIWLTLSVLDIYDTEVANEISRNDLQIRSLIGIDF